MESCATPTRPSPSRRSRTRARRPAPVRRTAARQLPQPPPPLTIPPAADPVELCRQARRLRATHRNDPMELHRQLSRLALADRTGSISQIPAFATYRKNWLFERLWRLLSLTAAFMRLRPTAAPSAIDQDEWPICSAEDAFRRTVEHRLLANAGSVLRYSQRLALLHEAARSGIARFEANLLIASVEHQLRDQVPTTTNPLPQRTLRIPGWMMFAALQSLISIGLWRLIKR